VALASAATLAALLRWCLLSDSSASAYTASGSAAAPSAFVSRRIRPEQQGASKRHGLRTRTRTLLVLSLSSNGGNSNSNSNKFGSDDWKGDGLGRDSRDSNQWRSSEDEQQQRQQQQLGAAGSGGGGDGDGEDWQDLMKRKQDGSFWSTFEPTEESESDAGTQSSSTSSSAFVSTEEQEAEAWLDTIASLSAEEVEFNLREADRADKVRQMQEWGFTTQAISSTLGVATDLSLEIQEEVQEGMQLFREQSYLEEVDLETVESHTRVEVDEETGEPVRNRMVYVDEHTCIGCTNCAMIAQSTFFMHSEHGRARVFNQWGDDDETIQIAIETCPVDCIHYVPYDELAKLEVERRGQNINFKARLVSQGEYGGLGLSHRVGGPNAFTAPQKISGNMGTRCNNCPTRGCANCPMYGVGLNPEYQKKEKLRKERMAKRKLQQQREREQKSTEL
jgi:ferredoxin